MQTGLRRIGVQIKLTFGLNLYQPDNRHGGKCKDITGTDQQVQRHQILEVQTAYRQCCVLEYLLLSEAQVAHLVEAVGSGGHPGGRMVKNLPAVQETRVQRFEFKFDSATYKLNKPQSLILSSFPCKMEIIIIPSLQG